jgi:hypothetical protein
VRVLLVIAVPVALGVAVAIAWGWFALGVYAGAAALALLLGVMLAILNRTGGSLARDAGRLTYERWMGNRR